MKSKQPCKPKLSEEQKSLLQLRSARLQITGSSYSKLSNELQEIGSIIQFVANVSQAIGNLISLEGNSYGVLAATYQIAAGRIQEFLALQELSQQSDQEDDKKSQEKDPPTEMDIQKIQDFITHLLSQLSQLNNRIQEAEDKLYKIQKRLK